MLIKNDNFGKVLKCRQFTFMATNYFEHPLAPFPSAFDWRVNKTMSLKMKKLNDK